MVRMSSCRGHEFAPYFGARDLSGDEAGSDESSESEGGAGEAAEGAGEDIEGAFADARDRWKIDAGTLKGFYFHSASSRLYGWNQARGILYEYDSATGDCTPVWAAACPQLNAEIWTVLPLPPTDPASLQPTSGASVSALASGDVLCVLHLSRARAAARARDAAEDFCRRLRLDARAAASLASLPLPGQAYVLRTFCAPSQDASGALRRQVEHLAGLAASGRCPWAGALESATLRVPLTGAILGRCVPEVAALCWDEDEDVAAAHCRIAHVDGRFCVCDLGAAGDDGSTQLDGRRLGAGWAPLEDGSRVEFGPVSVRVELTPVLAAPLATASASAPVLRMGGWRSAKRKGAAADAPSVLEPPAASFSSGPPAARDPSPVALRRGPSPALRRDPSPPSWRTALAPGRASPPRPRPPRAFCPAARGAGTAFWAAPRTPSESPASRSRSRSPDWVPRTPSPPR